MTTVHELVYRIAVAIKVTEALRDAIEANGGAYHGGLIPNLTSVTGTLTAPLVQVRQSIRQNPDLEPSADTLNDVLRMLNG